MKLSYTQQETSVGRARVTDSQQPNSDAKYKNEGIENPVLNLQGNFEMGKSSRLLSGVDFAFSPGRQQLSAQKVTGNQISGGNSAAPYVGIEHKLGNTLIGSLVKYTIMGDRKYFVKWTDGSEYGAGTSTGGNQLTAAVFAEHRIGLTQIGSSVSVVNQASITNLDEEDGDIYFEGFNTFVVRPYAAFNLAPNFQLVPSVEYRTLISRTPNGLQNYKSSDLDIQVAVRLSL